MKAVFTLITMVLTLPVWAEDKPAGKKHMLGVTFSVPNPSYKAKIEEVRQVGKELWVKVTVGSSGGIAPQVIGTAKADLAFEGPDLPVKYLVFGKAWGWKNEEPGLIFLKDLGDEKANAKIKEYEGGTVLHPKK